MEPPSFEYEQSLRDIQIVKAGDTAKFILRVYGKPAPSVKWTKDGSDVDVSHRVKVENTPTHTFLTIADTSRKDSGIVLPSQNFRNLVKLVVNFFKTSHF